MKYELKVIKAPPLDPDDPNARYVERSNEQIDEPNEPTSSPEDTDPSKLIHESLLNESENSEVESVDPKQVEHNLEVDLKQQESKRKLDEGLKAISDLRPVDRLDEDASLVTLNSVDASPVVHSVAKKSNVSNNKLSSSKSFAQLTKSSKNSTSTRSRPSKSVLDVLERRLKK